MGTPWSQNTAQQRRRVTTYERDGNESDEAMMRRYNRWHSRFDQPDPYDGAYDLSNPQSFNRYSYAQNDPVNFVDPSGLNAVSPGTTFGGSGILWKVWFGNSNDGFRLVFQWFEPHGGGGEQDLPPETAPTGDLEKNVDNLLKGDCGEFVKLLYEKVAAMNPQQKVHSENHSLLDVFNMVSRRSGGGGILIQPVTVGGKPAGGTIQGSIGDKENPPTIILSPVIYYNMLPEAGRLHAEYSYALRAVHESFHIAGYSDKQMAEAVHKRTGAPCLPKPGSTASDYSKYWQDILRTKCPEKKR